MIAESTKTRCDELSKHVIGAAIEVHTVLGPGLLESAYERSLCKELAIQNIASERQVVVPLEYKGEDIGDGYRIDILVEGLLIVELKSIKAIESIHEAQLLTQLRLSGKWLGLILNFNVPRMRDGIKRMVNG